MSLKRVETSSLRASRLPAPPSRLRGPGSEDEKERMSGQDGASCGRGFPGHPVGCSPPLGARQWHEDWRGRAQLVEAGHSPGGQSLPGRAGRRVLGARTGGLGEEG